MTYTKFGTFLETKNVQTMNENFDKIVGSIIESNIPFETFYTECLLPILTESQTGDPNELLAEVENWFQRNMPKFSKMFGGSQPAAPAAPASPTAPSPDEEAAAKNRAFNEKHSDTFNKIKNMFINGLKKAATEMQGNFARYPNAKMLVTAIQALVQNAAKATQGYQFKLGSSDEFYDKFQSNQAQAGQQKAILGALQSGNAQALLNMPDDQIIQAIQQQPQMRQQLTQLAKSINQQIQGASDATQKAKLQNQLRRLMKLTKFGMGSEFLQAAAKGQSQRDQIEKTVNDEAKQAEAKKEADIKAKERAAFDNEMFVKLMNNPNPDRIPKTEEELEFELDRLWDLHQKKLRKSTVGGPQSNLSSRNKNKSSLNTFMSKESTDHQNDLLVESLIRCTGNRK